MTDAVKLATDEFLADHIIDTGRRLTECKAPLGRSMWLPWLEREFGWTEQTALNFMRVNELSRSETKKFLAAARNLPVGGLYLIARPSTTESARDEVLNRAAGGEKVTHAEVKGVVARARPVKVDGRSAAAPPARAEAASKPADRKAAAFDNIARQLGYLVDLTEAVTPGEFLCAGGDCTPVRLSGIVDDARLAVEWLQKFMKLERPTEKPPVDYRRIAEPGTLLKGAKR